ncbi:MAG: MauE/DoxX family redox-associated membrane protein [Umezawaea sp.]
MDYLSFACRCLVGLVCGVSVIGKLRGRTAFREFAGTTRVLLIAAFPIGAISHAAARVVGGVVVAAEASVVLLLLVPGAGWIGLGLAVVLMAAFGYGIAATVRRGVRTSCRCFGASSTPLGTRHLVRNACLFLVAATGLLIGPVGSADPAGLAVAGAAAAVIALLVVRLDDVIDLFTPQLPMRRT